MKVKSNLLVIVVLTMLLSALFPFQQVEKVEAAAVCQVGTAQEQVVVRVYYEEMKDIDQLSGFDLFEFNNLDENYVLVAIEKSNISQIEILGFKVEIDEYETEQFNLPAKIMGSDLARIPGYECYRTVEETYVAAKQLANSHPTLATWIDAGDSWEKSVGQSDGNFE